jgi:hypothetical protein
MKKWKCDTCDYLEDKKPPRTYSNGKLCHAKVIGNTKVFTHCFGKISKAKNPWKPLLSGWYCQYSSSSKDPGHFVIGWYLTYKPRPSFTLHTSKSLKTTLAGAQRFCKKHGLIFPI